MVITFSAPYTSVDGILFLFLIYFASWPWCSTSQNLPGSAKVWPLACCWKQAQQAAFLLYFLLVLSLPVLLRLVLAEGEAVLQVKRTCCKNWMSPVKPPSATDTCSLSMKAFKTQGSCWTWLFWRLAGYLTRSWLLGFTAVMHYKPGVPPCILKGQRTKRNNLSACKPQPLKTLPLHSLPSTGPCHFSLCPTLFHEGCAPEKQPIWLPKMGHNIHAEYVW